MDWGGLLGGVGKGLIDLVLPAAATVISTQVVRLLAKQSKKIGLELDERQQDKLRQIIVDAVTRAEEMGRRGNLTGEQKRTAATDAALSEIRHEFPDDEKFTRDRIGKMIDTVLPGVRPLISDPTLATLAS